MQIAQALAEAEQAYERAVAAGQVKTVSGGVKRYTQAEFPGERTAAAEQVGAPSVSVASGAAGVTITIAQP